MTGARGDMTRRLSVQPVSYERIMQIACDASPWGFGAVLVEDGVPIRWLAGSWGTFELDLLGAVVGSSASQATFETLAILVAVREWFQEWQDYRTSIVLRSDSLAALGAVASGSSPNRAMSVICRELALDLAEGKYKTELMAHLPARFNGLADALSRLEAPGPDAKPFPPELDGIRRSVLTDRGPGWWRAVGDPGGEQRQDSGSSQQQLCYTDAADP